MLRLRDRNQTKLLAASVVAVLALALTGLASCSVGSVIGDTISNDTQEDAPRFRLTKATMEGEWRGNYSDLANVNGYSWLTEYEQESGGKMASTAYMGTGEWVFEYDSAGNLISRNWTNDHNAAGGYQWTYDEHGNKLTETDSVNGEVRSAIERSYDSNDVVRSEISDSSSGHVETSYDEHGNPVQIITENNLTAAATDGAVSDDLQTYEYEYDDDGNILVERLHHETGFLTSGAEDSTTTRTYDDEGRKLSESISYDNGALKGSYTQEWAYDEDGNIIYETGPQGENTETTYTYDDEGNPLTKTTTATNGNSKAAGTVLEETIWDYDEKGLLVRKETKSYGYDSVDTTIETYAYNEDGLLSYKENHLESANTRRTSRQYSYEYYPNGNVKTETESKVDPGDVSQTVYTSEFDEEGNLSMYALSRSDGRYGPLSIAFEYERI